MRAHIYADLMPYASEIEIESLAEDIKKNGLLNPIILFRKDDEDLIADGRTRYRACTIAGVEPRFIYYEGSEESLLQFVLSTNIHRRHLGIGQKSCLACEIMPMLEKQVEASRKDKISKSRSTGETSGIGETSRDAAGKLFGVSGKYVANARKLKTEREDLFVRVKSGELSLNKAMTEMKSSAGKVETVENFPESQVEVEEVVNVVAPVELSKLELRKVSELVEFGMSEQRAREYIVSKRKIKSSAPKQKSFSESRVEFKLSAEKKSELVQLAKSKNQTLSDYLRAVLGV